MRWLARLLAFIDGPERSDEWKAGYDKALTTDGALLPCEPHHSDEWLAGYSEALHWILFPPGPPL